MIATKRQLSRSNSNIGQRASARSDADAEGDA
jgi:hypothetical protein